MVGSHREQVDVGQGVVVGMCNGGKPSRTGGGEGQRVVVGRCNGGKPTRTGGRGSEGSCGYV